MPFAQPGGVAGEQQAKEDVSYSLFIFCIIFCSSEFLLPASFYETVSDANWMCVELRTSMLLAETPRAMPIR